jgi:urea transport system substrate-binding protein
MREVQRLRKTKTVVVLGLAVVAIVSGWLLHQTTSVKPLARPIKVGVLHSLTGTMAISERSVLESTLLAIEVVNERGGVLGRTIEPVVADGSSDGSTFAREAERLITEEQVAVVFGCWTSASRKTVKPVFERLNHLLIYPVQYEGLEESPNIVYTGAAPNQQILPAVKWCLDHLGRRFFLVGSDYVFPRSAHAIIRDHLNALGGEVVGEEYILLGSTDVQEAVQKIVKHKPDVILNTINGDSNVAFFRELRAKGISPKDVPTLSFSIAETELQSLENGEMVGNYAAWNYFQSIESEENRDFVSRFKEKYGEDHVTSDPMEAAYFGVHLWCQAVEDSGTDDVNEVRKTIAGQSLLAPEGVVSVDRRNRHTWKTVRIGAIQPDGQFDIVWSSGQPIAPIPFPGSRPRDDWKRFLNQLYEMWGRQWANPGLPRKQVEELIRLATEQLQAGLSKHPLLVSTAVAAAQQNRLLSEQKVLELDREWRGLGEESSPISSVMNHQASELLRSFREEHPSLPEIMVTDATGLIVAMTNKTSDYYQADEAWWVETYQEGVGNVFKGDVEYDQSAVIWGVAVCVPIDGQDGQVVGGVKAFLDLQELLPAG